MIAFYKTPLGKKMIEQEPKAGEESTKRAQVWIDKYAEDVMARMRAEMKKARPQRVLSRRASAPDGAGQCRKRSICSSSARDRAACAPPASRPATARA